MYSPKKLLAQGAMLASPHLLNNPDMFHTGDIYLLHTRYSFLSWLVMYYEPSPWSHTGTISQNKNSIDATTSGVIEHPISDYLDNKSYILIYRPNVNTENCENSINKMRSQFLGMQYGWRTVFYIFLVTVYNKKRSYRIKYTLDFLFIIFLINLIFQNNTIFWISLIFSVFNILIILWNGFRGRYN